jgi:hypothetical protein
MPDITMCGDETCPLKTACYRNPESGTEPSKYQSWFASRPLWSRRKLVGEMVLFCPYFWKKAPRKEKTDG